MNKEIKDELVALRQLAVEIKSRVEKIIDIGVNDIESKLNYKDWKQKNSLIRKWISEERKLLLSEDMKAKGAIVSEVKKITLPVYEGNNKYHITNPSIEWVRTKILEAGSKFGNVWFYKREDGSLRKMAYKLHVSNPTYSKKPSSLKGARLNLSNMTVYDVNKVVRDASGKIIGRGSYRTIPLENVVRIVSNGNTYEIKWDTQPKTVTKVTRLG